MTIPDNILRRIEALHTLATDPCTPDNEINVAMLAIQRLLDRHNLELASVLGSSKGKAPEIIQGSETAFPFERVSSWLHDLMYAVEQFYSVKVIYWRGSRLKWVGYPTDVAIASRVFSILLARLELMATERTKEYTAILSAEGYNTKRLKGNRSIRVFRESYLAGAIAGLQSGLFADRADNKEITALVSLKGKQVEEYVKANYKLKYSSNNNQSRFNSGAHSLGVQDGSKIRLDKEIK